MSSLSLSSALSLPVKFQAEWTRKKPPAKKDWHLEVQSQSDCFKSPDSRQPSDKLLQHAIDSLMAPKGSGFCVISGLMKTLGLSEAGIVYFQNQITRALCSKLHWEPSGQEPDLCKEYDYGNMLLHLDYSLNMMISEPNHYKNVPFLSLAYPPFKGIDEKEGRIQVANIPLWIREHPLLSKLPFISFLSDQKGSAYFTKNLKDSLFSQTQKKIFKNYIITLDEIDHTDDMPVVLINNAPVTGVFHGRTGLTSGVNSHGDERIRGFYRMFARFKD